MDPDEILTGLKTVLGITLSKEEIRDLIAYLDSDQSGDIDLGEFCAKINLDNIHKDSHKFVISELTFIEKMLAAWYMFKKREKIRVQELIAKFDDNGDGVMQLSEFEALILHLEPGTTKKTVITLFKEALSMTEEDAEADAISPEILIRQLIHYKIGGFCKEFFSAYLKQRKTKFFEKKGKVKK